jgi:hypothetical protein
MNLEYLMYGDSGDKPHPLSQQFSILPNEPFSIISPKSQILDLPPRIYQSGNYLFGLTE